MTTRIAFVNGKGGVGKTTCATMIAAAFNESGESVSIQDRDPQGTATTAAGIFGLPVGGGHPLVLIDTAPNMSSPETLDAIRNADLVVLVTTPSPVDLATTAATARLIQSERKGETRILFNLVQTTNRFFYEMPGIAEIMPFPVFKNFLTRLTVYQVAQLSGWKAFPKNNKLEVIRVAIEILQQLPKATVGQ